MNNDTYGLIAENPVRLNSTKAAMGYLEHLVTKHDGYHILFHKLMSFDFNLFDGKKETAEYTSEIYQICTNNKKIINLSFNIHSPDLPDMFFNCKKFRLVTGSESIWNWFLYSLDL